MADIDQHRDEKTFVWAAALAIALVLLCIQIQPDSFERFLGSVSPLLVFLAVTVLAIAPLSVARRLLAKVDSLPTVSTRPRRTMILYLLALSIFGLSSISVDLIAPFPRDINVSFPVSLFYYPAMAFLAECVFHVLPLATLVLLGARTEKKYLIAVVLTSSIEPIFQLVLGFDPDRVNRNTWLLLQVFAINVVIVSLFRHYGFIGMLSFRTAYYFIWHIVWGALRLRILYSS